MPDSVSTPRHSAERMKAFVDAVVAIAITLLILPVTESATQAADKGLTTPEFFAAYGSELVSFLVTFMVIASLWFAHHGLHLHVDRYHAGLYWTNVLWMLTIVWLPIASVLLGLPTDAFQRLVYIGTMLLNALILLWQHLLVRRHPELCGEPGLPTAGGLAAAIALTLLFATALGLAFIPGIGYLAMFVLLLTNPVASLIERLLERRLGVAQG